MTSYRGFWQEGAHEAAEAKRQEARRLHDQGYSVRYIAVRLDREEQTVREYLRIRQPQLGGDYIPDATTWEDKARQMAECYPDEQRRRWIYLQMGVER